MPPKHSQEPRRPESPARMTAPPVKPVMPPPVTAPQGDGPAVVGADQAAFDAVKCEEQPEPTAALDATPEPPDPRPWQPLDTAPRDGTLLEGRFSTGAAMMIWRRTTRYSAAKMRWVPTGFWSSSISREPLKEEPDAWRTPDGFASPGAIVA